MMTTASSFCAQSCSSIFCDGVKFGNCFFDMARLLIVVGQGPGAIQGRRGVPEEVPWMNAIPCPAAVAGLQIGDVIFQFGICLRGLTQSSGKLDQVLAHALIIGTQCTDLFINANGLLPIQFLHINICHALKDVNIPTTVSICLLDKT